MGQHRAQKERPYEILPIRRQIIRQPFPAQRVDDRVSRERAGALFAVRHERFARLRHLRDGVFGGFVLRFDELVAADGAGVVVCVGFLEVWLCCQRLATVSRRGERMVLGEMLRW